MENNQTKTVSIQTGRLYDEQGKSFDITVILNWPTEAEYEDYENSTSIDPDFPSVNLVDFYFGDPDESTTDDYVQQFVEKQASLQKLYQKLLELKSQNPDDLEINEQIDFVQSLIVTIH